MCERSLAVACLVSWEVGLAWPAVERTSGAMLSAAPISSPPAERPVMASWEGVVMLDS